MPGKSTKFGKLAADEWVGIPIQDTDLFSLNYADDQIVLSQDAFDPEYMMRKLKKSYSRSGLHVNFNKTE
jgi:hypothetical protein